jgi:hypothetical protein
VNARWRDRFGVWWRTTIRDPSAAQRLRQDDTQPRFKADAMLANMISFEFDTEED